VIRCYCCERRWPESADLMFGACECCEYTCEGCLLCTEHCECREPEPLPLPTAIVKAQEP
jgi:hypothetical protein